MASTGSTIQSTAFLKLDTCRIDDKFDTPAIISTYKDDLSVCRRPVSPPLPCCIGSMTNVCVNCGAMKWKGEAPGMCCRPGEAGHWSLCLNVHIIHWARLQRI